MIRNSLYKTLLLSLAFSSISLAYGPMLIGPKHSSFGPFILNGNEFNCKAYTAYADYCEQTSEFNDVLVEAIRFERKWKIAYGCKDKITELRNCLSKKSNLPDAKLTDEIKDYLNSIK